MKSDMARVRGWCSRDFLLLAALHLLLLGVGVVTLYYRQVLAASGWPDVVRGAYDGDIDSFLVGMVIVGAALVVATVVGAIAAILRNKKLLAATAVGLLLVLGGVIFLAVKALVVNDRAVNWTHDVRTDSVRAAKDAVIATRFDALYCDAQRAYLCDHATLTELLTFGLGNITTALEMGDSSDANSRASAFSSSMGSSSTATDSISTDDGATVLCAQYGTDSTENSRWQELCAFCAAADTSYEDVATISRWSEGHCAYRSQSIAWCSQNEAMNVGNSSGSGSGSVIAVSIGASASGSASQTSASGSDTSAMVSEATDPFSRCRQELLDTAADWSQGFGIGWSVAGAFLVLLLVCVGFLLSSEVYADAVDLDDVGDDDDDDEFVDAYTYSKA